MAPLPAAIWQQSTQLYDKLRNYYVKDVGTFLIIASHKRLPAVVAPKQPQAQAQTTAISQEQISLTAMSPDTPAPPPLVSPETALLCALLYTVIYVAPFYLSPTLRSTPLQSRDAPTVIRARVRAVGLTCVVCTVITVYVLAIYGHATPRDVARLLGTWPIELVDGAKVWGLLAVLFVGPLYESIIVDGDWRGWSLSEVKEGLLDSWIGYRNLVIAPASEELVFRALTISVYLAAKVDPTRIVLLTPLIFGLAHVHHLVDFVRSRTPAGQFPPLGVVAIGVARSLFQFTYTTLFGFFAAFVFLRTGNLWAVIVAHSFCNWMGVPRIWGKVGQYAAGYDMHMTPDVAQGKKDDVPGSPVKVGNSLMQDHDGNAEVTAAAQVMPQNLGTGWTVLYYALMLLGSYGFYELLWPLTESSNALASL